MTQLPSSADTGFLLRTIEAVTAPIPAWMADVPTTSTAPDACISAWLPQPVGGGGWGGPPTPPAAPGALPLLVMAPHFGPVGRRRRPAAVVTGAVLTLGVSGLVWHRHINEEMVDFDPRLAHRATRSSWALTIPVVAVWMMALAAIARSVATYLGHPVGLRVGEEVTRWLALAPLALPWMLLLLPPCLIAVLMTAERVRVLEDRVDILGGNQIRPAAVAWWLALPVVGGLILMTVQQRRLNRVWARALPGPAS